MCKVPVRVSAPTVIPVCDHWNRGKTEVLSAQDGRTQIQGQTNIRPLTRLIKNTRPVHLKQATSIFPVNLSHQAGEPYAEVETQSHRFSTTRKSLAYQLTHNLTCPVHHTPGLVSLEPGLKSNKIFGEIETKENGNNTRSLCMFSFWQGRVLSLHTRLLSCFRSCGTFGSFCWGTCVVSHRCRSFIWSGAMAQLSSNFCVFFFCSSFTLEWSSQLQLLEGVKKMAAFGLKICFLFLTFDLIFTPESTCSSNKWCTVAKIEWLCKSFLITFSSWSWDYFVILSKKSFNQSSVLLWWLQPKKVSEFERSTPKNPNHKKGRHHRHKARLPSQHLCVAFLLSELNARAHTHTHIHTFHSTYYTRYRQKQSLLSHLPPWRPQTDLTSTVPHPIQC